MFVQAGSNSKQTISSLELFSSGFLCNGETKSPRRPPRLVDTNKSGTELVSKGKLYQQHHILENINDRTWIHPDCVQEVFLAILVIFSTCERNELKKNELLFSLKH